MIFHDLPLRPGQSSGVNTGTENGTERPGRFLTEVGDPRLLVHQAETPTGAAVVICPGGGYRGVSFDKEGLDFARLLAGWGITSAVLLYRQPGGVFVDPPLPLADVREALAAVVRRASDWSVDPARVGVLGFSAGGHLAWTAVREPGPEGIRPAFQILGYPVVSFLSPLAHEGSRDNLLGAGAPPALVDRFSGERGLPGGLGPTFVVHAENDASVPVANSTVLKAALTAAGNPCELVLHPTGGHGFGFGPAHGFVDAPDWVPALKRWLVNQGLAR